jgi:hypothetical protein
MQPQGVVIRKFYDILVVEAKSIFQRVSAEVEDWLYLALSPLTMQLKEHEEMLERRLDSLRKIGENVRNLELRTHQLERLEGALRRHVEELDAVRQVLIPPVEAPGQLPEPSPARQAQVA